MKLVLLLLCLHRMTATPGVTETDALLDLLEHIRSLCEVDDECMEEMVADMIYMLSGEGVEEGVNHTFLLLRLVKEFCSDKGEGCIKNSLEDLTNRALDLV